jgi:hypothetical protein
LSTPQWRTSGSATSGANEQRSIRSTEMRSAECLPFQILRTVAAVLFNSASTALPIRSRPPVCGAARGHVRANASIVQLYQHHMWSQLKSGRLTRAPKRSGSKSGVAVFWLIRGDV